MPTIHKTFEIQVLQGSDKGGRILINTGSVDRDRDRVMPSGMRTESYLKNPVVQWGHNYRDPWATVGKTTNLQVTTEGVIADFELRPAANDQDPQNIVRLLWEGGWVRTASVGFIPVQGKQNPEGGMDFNDWELLEWSLVPIPANQDALRLAVKGFNEDIHEITPTEAATEAPVQKSLDEMEQKRGRVISRSNEDRLRQAIAMLTQILDQLENSNEPAPEGEPDDDEAGKSAQLITVGDADEVAQEANTSTAAAQSHDSVQAGLDEASTAAAANNELAEVIREYLKTIKEVLA